MLTFEKVLEVFSDYLDDDEMYEVVFTSHGYTLLEWDRQCGDWTGVKLCPTPEALVNALMYGYTGLLEYRATLGRRELNDNDRAQVDTARQAVLAKLNG